MKTKPIMTINARYVRVALDPATGVPVSTEAGIHYKLDRSIKKRGVRGDYGIIECVGDGRGWTYTTSLHSLERCTILDGLPGWLPPLPAGWDIPAIEFAADLDEAVAA